MFRFGTAFLVLVAVSFVAAPASAQTTTCIPAAELEGVACTDGNPCTSNDVCRDGACVGTPGLFCEADACRFAGLCLNGEDCIAVPRDEGADCDDGDPCTTGDACNGGECAGTPGCDDGDPCTTDACGETGCSNTAIPGCVACPDGTCDDGNACTTDTCDDGVCVFKADVVVCSDGDACTQGDTCVDGACVPGDPVVCTASDQCHVAGVCDPATGVCSDPVAPPNTPCDDGDACTQTDGCQAGSCVGANHVVCTALDQCHLPGTCNPATGACSNPSAADLTSCSDGNACTNDDVCQGGACVPGALTTCTASDQCHSAGTCNPDTGLCSDPARPDDTPCTDGNACTDGDTCQGGTCTAGTPKTCTALDQCHDAGTCNPQTGVCSNPSKPDDAACSDGNACTDGDTCRAGTCTAGTAKTCVALDQCHTAGTCDPQSGVCSNPAKPDDTACTDGNACTLGDTCQAGTCTAGTPKTCTALDQCHTAGTCDPGTGVCSDPPKPDDTACTDGNACTDGDTCQGGTCTAGTPKTCTALDQCHVAGTCNPGTGVCSNPNAPNTTPCDDGDGCTENDVCQTGTCTAGPRKTCNDGDGCTTDGCSAGQCVNTPQSGCIPCGPTLPACGDGNTCTTDTCVAGKCQFANNTLPCDDQNPCTTASVCQAGTCIGTTTVVCQPTNQCRQAGTCVPATGLCSVGPPRTDGTPCDDGDACSEDDTCAAGACAAGTPRDCGDGVPCTDDRCTGGACVNEPLDARCVPGDCLAGQCAPGTPGADADGCIATPVADGSACTDDGITCTEDVCTETGCEHRPVDDRCTPPGDCAAAVCRPGTSGADAVSGCVEVAGPGDGSECAEDGDPCTDDVCADGDCSHELAGEVTTCRPVEGPYRRARSLLEYVRTLRALVSASVTPDQGGGLPGNRTLLLERLDGAETDLDLAVRMLSGKIALPATRPLLTPNARPSANLLEPTLAQQRGRIAFTQVKNTPAKVRAFLSLLALAKRRAEVTGATARDLRQRGRSLLTGTKALKRDLKRLQRVSQVLAR